jgi:cysteinyl-tRNA synthetase
LFDAEVLHLGLFEGVEHLVAQENIAAPDEIVAMAQARIAAKTNKDYARADELRDQITAA